MKSMINTDEALTINLLKHIGCKLTSPIGCRRLMISFKSVPYFKSQDLRIPKPKYSVAIETDAINT